MPDTGRIGDIWGERTPFAAGSRWAARVDQELDVPESEVERWVQSACVLCSNGCGLDIAVAGDRIVGVRGREVDRVNHGRLGPKGLHGWRANNSPDRLTQPLVRRNGRLEPASWDEAMGLVVEQSQSLLAEAGPLALGFYTSGQLFAEEYYALAKLARAGIGTPHLDGNTRLCTATAEWALIESFGTDGDPGSYTDIDECDTLFLVGHNVAETQTVLWMRMLDRLHGPDRPKLVVVDPRPTPAAREADVHLPIRSGTNVALLNAILAELIVNDWIDEPFVAEHTVGFEALRETVLAYPPERAAEICGVLPGAIREAARLIGSGRKLVSTVLQGVYQSNQATAAAVQVNNVNLLRGMIGKPGCSVFQMNGQPPAENARDRRQRCTSRLPQLRERCARRRARRALERRAAPHPALGAADACHADLPLRRGGLDPVPLDHRDEPRRLASGAPSHPVDPEAGAPVRRRLRRLHDGDRGTGGRRAAERALGREDRHVHERRPDRAPLRPGRGAARRGSVRLRRRRGLRPPARPRRP